MGAAHPATAVVGNNAVLSTLSFKNMGECEWTMDCLSGVVTNRNFINGWHPSQIMAQCSKYGQMHQAFAGVETCAPPELKPSVV